MSRWFLCASVPAMIALSSPSWAAPPPYEPDYPPAPVVFRMYVTDCANVPMPAALVSVFVLRGNQVLGPYMRIVDRDGNAWVDLPTNCCDEVKVTVSPAYEESAPYQTFFHRACEGYCTFGGFGEIVQEIPVDDPCHPAYPHQQGDPPPCCNELMPDGVTWHIRYHVSP